MTNNRVYKVLGLVALFVFLAVLPFNLKYHQQDFMIFLLINILAVSSYRLMTLTGEWSLIHVVMMGVGAYASALLAKKVGLSFWLTMPLSGIVCALMAFILSFPLFRMKQFYFLIGSFAAGEAVRLAWVFFKVPFGGPKGMKNVPSPKLWIPGLETIEIWEPIPYYFLTLVIVTICLWILYRLENSRIGLTLHSIHWRDVLAESVGVNPWRYRTLAFVIASFFVGIAGTLLAHYLGSINPNQFAIGIMVYVLVWVIVGGTATFIGPIIGVTVLSLINDMFLRAFDIWRPFIYGCILIASITFLPDGLESLPAKIRGGIRRSRSEAEPEIDAAKREEKKRRAKEQRILRIKSWWLIRRP